MTLFFVLLTLAVVGVVAAVALGRISGGMDEPTSTVPVHPLPPGELTPSDLDEVRFAPALRGYRMDQVDAALDRLRGELARRDDELVALRGGRNEALVGASAGYAGGGRKRAKPGAATAAEPEPAATVSPAEPVGAEPVPVESVPVESVPVESVPVESVPVESVPVEPVRGEAVGAAPVAPVAVSEPAPSVPDDAPTAAQPVVTDEPAGPGAKKAPADEA